MKSLLHNPDCLLHQVYVYYKPTKNQTDDIPMQTHSKQTNDTPTQTNDTPTQTMDIYVVCTVQDVHDAAVKVVYYGDRVEIEEIAYDEGDYYFHVVDGKERMPFYQKMAMVNRTIGDLMVNAQELLKYHARKIKSDMALLYCIDLFSLMTTHDSLVAKELNNTKLRDIKQTYRDQVKDLLPHLSIRVHGTRNFGIQLQSDASFILFQWGKKKTTFYEFDAIEDYDIEARFPIPKVVQYPIPKVEVQLWNKDQDRCVGKSLIDVDLVINLNYGSGKSFDLHKEFICCRKTNNEFAYLEIAIECIHDPGKSVEKGMQRSPFYGSRDGYRSSPLLSPSFSPNETPRDRLRSSPRDTLRSSPRDRLRSSPRDTLRHHLSSPRNDSTKNASYLSQDSQHPSTPRSQSPQLTPFTKTSFKKSPHEPPYNSNSFHSFASDETRNYSSLGETKKHSPTDYKSSRPLNDSPNVHEQYAILQKLWQPKENESVPVAKENESLSGVQSQEPYFDLHRPSMFPQPFQIRKAPIFKSNGGLAGKDVEPLKQLKASYLQKSMKYETLPKEEFIQACKDEYEENSKKIKTIFFQTGCDTAESHLLKIRNQELLIRIADITHFHGNL